MLYVGVLLPWVNSIVIYFIPLVCNLKYINGNCIGAVWPKKAMKDAYRIVVFIWQFILPLFVFVSA